MSDCRAFIAIFLCCTAVSLFGVEYFVSPDGSDDHPGTSLTQAFRTVNRGLSAIQGGDILRIQPGIYRESVSRQLPNPGGLPILIKAEIPGTVLLRGDVELPVFEKFPGSAFIWSADFALAEPTAINERDTYRIYTPAASVRELEFTRGKFFYDLEAKRLYVCTSDGQSPAQHYLTASVIAGSGFLLTTENVTVEGLAVTGFYSHYRNFYGLRLSGPGNNRVRNCQAFFNSNGIHLGCRKDSSIEDCTVYANGSNAPVSGGNMVCWGDCENIRISNCRSFFSTHPNNLEIRFYGGTIKDSRVENSISYGSIGLKANTSNTWCINSVNGGQGYAAENGRNNVFRGGNAYNAQDTSLNLDTIPRAEWDGLFADPENYDFHPQSDARGLENGLIDDGNIYFITPAGNDSAEGRSLKQSWRSLAKLNSLPKGSIVYLSPGRYPGTTLLAQGLKIRTRGIGNAAVITGDMQVKGQDLEFSNLNFIAGRVEVTGRGNRFHACGFEAVLSIAGQDTALTHNAFSTQPVAGNGAGGYKHSNIYLAGLQTALDGFVDFDLPGENPQFRDCANGDFTVANHSAFLGRGFDGHPAGPYRLVRAPQESSTLLPQVHSVTESTINVEWWTNSAQGSSELQWGLDPECLRSVGQSYSGSYYHTVTLENLAPGTRYYFRAVSRSPLREHHSNEYYAAQELTKARKVSTSAVSSACTETAVRESQTFYVSMQGDDRNAGTKSAPFRSLNQALNIVRAGDTVLLRGGSYTEEVHLRAGGSQGRPITIRNFPGEKVILDGRRIIADGIIIDNKSYIIIDGIYFREFNNSTGAAVRINGGHDITVRRCFADSRSNGYTPGLIYANMVRGLTVANCVISRGFYGATFWRCPDLQLLHNVWYLNQICHFYLHNTPEEKAHLVQNIFFDIIPSKFRDALIGSQNLESVLARDNCFYLRCDPARRAIFSFTRQNGERLEKPKGNYQNYCERSGMNSRAVFVNPGIPALKEHLQFSFLPEIDQQGMHFSYPEEVTAMGTLSNRVELHKQPDGTFKDWTFSDFFATEPACREIGAGLQPEEFTDVH
ncbi:MAG: DUF1565 domain-containing protein [Oligosphaeraceae bacterium]|nr:DUF1565 domain-containing protein [Oligosphaeraceae bacterium]